MHADYLEIRKNFLSHASMAGMPSNLRTPEKRAKEARKQAFKNYDRNVNGQMTQLILEEDKLAKQWASGKISDSDALRGIHEITAKGFALGLNSSMGKNNPNAILNTLLRAIKGGYNGYDNVLSEADAERIRKFEARMATIDATGRKDIYRSAGSRAGMPSNIHR